MSDLQPATCTRCGRPGKSKNPQWYRCGQCYYHQRALANEHQIEQMMARIEKLRQEQAYNEAQRDKFVAKHGYREMKNVPKQPPHSEPHIVSGETAPPCPHCENGGHLIPLATLSFKNRWMCRQCKNTIEE